MIEINLTKGKIAIIDDDDFDLVKRYSWHAHLSPNNKNNYYARTNILIDGKSSTVLMHRLILNITDSKVMIDHEDNDGLNNSKSNLRIATNSQNQGNRKLLKSDKTSEYRGVHKAIKTKRTMLKSGYVNIHIYEYWQCNIGIGKKQKIIGLYKNEIEAALAYNKAAVKHFKEFASLNIIKPYHAR